MKSGYCFIPYYHVCSLCILWTAAAGACDPHHRIFVRDHRGHPRARGAGGEDITECGGHRSSVLPVRRRGARGGGHLCSGQDPGW